MIDPLEEHFGYLSDRVKVEQYRKAIECTVRPGHVVMDLGCGSGLLGLMALRAGAGRVLFVEEGAIIEVARRTIAEAGLTERAQFLRLKSFELALPDRVDVILCDHVGYFGFDYGILALLADARARFLKPDGVIVPGEIALGLAPVETGRGCNLVQRWRGGDVPGEFAWAGAAAANTKHPINLAADNLIADPATLTHLTLGDPPGEFLKWQAAFTCARDGRLDGLLGWFECALHDEIRMSNSPVAQNALERPQAFLPLDEPVAVRAGETIHSMVMARPADHIIAWTVDLPAQGVRESMSTFNGLLLDDEALERSRPERTARLNDRGRAHQVVLSYCDGKRTVAEVEVLVRKEHPDLFPSERATALFVRKVLTWDTGG